MTPSPNKYAAAFLISAAFLSAQTTAPTSPAASKGTDETIQIPEFTVTTTPSDTNLIGDEATSTTRIATSNSFDLPQTVKRVQPSNDRSS